MIIIIINNALYYQSSDWLHKAEQESQYYYYISKLRLHNSNVIYLRLLKNKLHIFYVILDLFLVLMFKGKARFIYHYNNIIARTIYCDAATTVSS